MSETITSILRNLVRHPGESGFLFLDSKGRESQFSFSQIAQAAEQRGRQLLAYGLQPQNRLALIISNNQDFVLSFLGCVAVNIIPVPIYPPPPMGKKERQLIAALNIMKAGAVHGLLSSQDTLELLETAQTSELILPPSISLEDLHEIHPSEAELTSPAPEDTCFIQFTSGSSAAPKGVVVSHQSLVANTNAIVYDGLKADPQKDRGLSWLPLYHDMGLIGFVLAPIVGTIPVIIFPTFSFVRRPSLWMQYIDKYRATISFGPNFAFALASKRAKQNIDAGIDLSCLRILGCGAEPISAKVMRQFSEAHAAANFSAQAITPSYGMAEACLAISFEPLDSDLLTIQVNGERLQSEGQVELCDKNSPGAQEFVACGHGLRNHILEIRSEKDEVLSDNQVGEIVFRGPSVNKAYFQNSKESENTFRPHGLYTQDIGFLRDKRLFICGRKKDLIILNGKNYHPESLEWLVEQSTQIRQGGAVCFSITGNDTESLVVVAETADTNNQTLRDQIRQDFGREFGLKLDLICLVKPGQLPKTSSGKRQRRKTKELFEAGQWSD